jgi:hypothetical protein
MKVLYQSWSDDDPNAPIFEETVEKIKERLFAKRMTNNDEYCPNCGKMYCNRMNRKQFLDELLEFGWDLKEQVSEGFFEGFISLGAADCDNCLAKGNCPGEHIGIRGCPKTTES